MTTPAVLDIEALLAPISDEAPTGVNPREDISPSSLYYQIKDARAQARAAERAAVFDAEDGQEPDWRPVLELAPQILTGHAKDLEIVAWMIEALARREGFAGMRDGFAVARGLVERYWDDLYPTPDEDGMLTRVAPITGLNGEDAEGTLIVPIAMVPITVETDLGAFSSYHYDQARELARVEDEEARQARVDAGAISSDVFMAAFHATPPEFYADLVEDMQACLEEFRAMIAAFDERAGEASPPSSNIVRAIEAVLDSVRFLARDVLPAAGGDEPAGEDGQSAGAAAGGGSGGGGGGDGRIQNREQAFQSLAKVAQYFRGAEPHSPIPYMIEQAVRWGRTPLPGLVAQLIPDEGARQTFCQLTGIPYDDVEEQDAE